MPDDRPGFAVPAQVAVGAMAEMAINVANPRRLPSAIPAPICPSHELFRPQLIPQRVLLESFIPRKALQSRRALRELSAQGPGNKGQYFCTGWVRKNDCKQGRDPKSDGLDCGFHFDKDQVRRKESMHSNLAWDRLSSWGLHGIPKHQWDARQAYFHGMTSTNPTLETIRALRSEPITIPRYYHNKAIQAPADLIGVGLTALGQRPRTPPPSPVKKRKLNPESDAGPSRAG
ncbi:hypothetical protein PENSPDRAFT_669040 [Peniophora sp. CONT]|nr:hypothetical protein PENSPDRAFT_669040 [Peniophora sp. CONT]